MAEEHTAEFVASAKKFFAHYAGFQHAVEVLENLASYENAVKEAQGRLDALAREHEAAKGKAEEIIAAADAEIAAKRNGLAEDIARAGLERQTIIDEATEKASRILSAARAEAAGFEQQLNVIRASGAQHRQEITRLKAEIAQHEQARDQAKDDAEEARRQHESERSALRAFRASLPQ